MNAKLRYVLLATVLYEVMTFFRPLQHHSPIWAQTVSEGSVSKGSMERCMGFTGLRCILPASVQWHVKLRSEAGATEFNVFHPRMHEVRG